jgi:multiple sugar transport system permease protein
LALTGPALIWFVVFMIAPLVSMFYLATLGWSSLLAPPRFAGLGNFMRMIGDPIFATALRNSAVHLVATLPVMIPLAFLLGYFLSRKPPGHRILAVIFFTPALISVSARAMIFAGVYQPDGMLNALLRAIGLGSATHNWLADSSTALWTIIAVDIWAGIGFTGVLFGAALSAISEDVYEAARLDGASTWTIVWRIAYPMSREFVGVMTMLQFLWILLSSAQNVLLLTQGGPGSTSLTLSYLLYDQAFVSTQIGYSQAIGVMLFVVGLTGMLLIRRAFRQVDR